MGVLSGEGETGERVSFQETRRKTKSELIVPCNFHFVVYDPSQVIYSYLAYGVHVAKLKPMYSHRKKRRNMNTFLDW